MATTLSSNHWGHDLQVHDAMNWLLAEHPDQYQAILADFPEYRDNHFDGAQFDTERMGIDAEWSSWLTDAIEATGLVYWEDGEPWATTD